MKKSSRTTGRSKAALTAAALAIPFIGALPEAVAQKPTTAPSRAPVISPARSNFTIKLASTVQLVGIDSGRIVYRNKAGEHFYLDGATGDMVFVD